MSKMLKCTPIFFMIIILTASCFAGAFQQQENLQRKQLFDFNWKFILTDNPEASKINFDDQGWRSLDLPHDWSIEGSIDTNNSTGQPGGYFCAGIGWYRKKFNVPSSWKDKHISIYFEGVYMNSKVFINGNCWEYIRTAMG